MPKPAFIVCSRSGAYDQFTKSISCFDVIDSFDFIVLEKPIAQKDAPSAQIIDAFRLVSCWLKDGDKDTDVEFEAEVLLRFSNDEIWSIARFSFKFTGNLLSQRLTVQKIHLPGAPCLGYATIECRVRKMGTEDWIGQHSVGLLLKEAIKDAKTEPLK